MPKKAAVKRRAAAVKKTTVKPADEAGEAGSKRKFAADSESAVNESLRSALECPICCEVRASRRGRAPARQSLVTWSTC